MELKNIMVTGNLGYIGNVLVPILAEAGYNVVGYDIGYYDDCLLLPTEQKLAKQIKKDIRDVTVEDLKGIDCVLHLAGLSNDPLGELNESLTEDINYKGTIKLAECAKEAGVKRFIFTSSQSVYGISDTTKEIDEAGKKNPITAYAKAKWNSECVLHDMCSDDFTIAYLRPATAYGASPNQRLDIVFNQFVAYAFVENRIEIKSDGAPWKPMTHVKDICAAFLACIKAPKELIRNEAFNVGTSDNNFTVRMLAETAQKYVPGTSLTFTGEHTDSRSYRVSSEKILTRLADYYQPEWNIEKGADELMNHYKEIGLDEEIFKGWKCTRLKCIKKKVDEGVLDTELRMVEK